MGQSFLQRMTATLSNDLVDSGRDWDSSRFLWLNAAVVAVNRHPDHIPGWSLAMRAKHSEKGEVDEAKGNFDVKAIPTGLFQKALNILVRRSSDVRAFSKLILMLRVCPSRMTLQRRILMPKSFSANET